MLIAALKTLFNRDLNRLYQEIQAYQNEQALWRTAPGISNSAGNLCLHLLGNLDTYIGAEIAHTGYVRDRDREFSAQNIPRAELLAGITATRRMVDATITPLPDALLATQYPVVIWETPTSLGYLLLHLTTHLAYHLRQINYHRRLMDNG